MAAETNYELKLTEVVRTYWHGDWGFTGTRAGMTLVQHSWCRRILKDGHPTKFFHGGAFGADTQVHAIWKEIKVRGDVARVWPADAKRRAMFLNQPNVFVEDVMDPLARNAVIVERSAFLLATPHTQAEILRSGTWSTIRAAIKEEVPVLIVWPNGKLTLHRDKVLYRVV